MAGNNDERHLTESERMRMIEIVNAEREDRVRRERESFLAARKRHFASIEEEARRAEMRLRALREEDVGRMEVLMRNSHPEKFWSGGHDPLLVEPQPSKIDELFKEWKEKLKEREAQLTQTKNELDEAKKVAGQNAVKAADAEKLSERLRQEVEQKKRHIDLSHLLTRVNSGAAERLLRDDAFQSEFLKSPCDAYVLAIDVRRSTELMLKARDPAGFAEFLIQLAGALKSTVLENDGVFEKFTGDGVLAYFPEHFSGKDAGYRALAAASKCHDVFETLYRANRRRFSSVIKNTGLGIGIDHGVVHTMVVSGEFAVVGTPVVYACRMAGAEAGETLLNQGAFESISELYEAYCSIEETEIEIKHEGPTVAYRVELNGKKFDPQPPLWGVEGPLSKEDGRTKGTARDSSEIQQM